jgi:hypothetical protein
MSDDLARMAQRGHRAIELHPDLGPDKLDLESAASDIIADILHALDDAALDLDPQDVLDRALRCYRGDIEDAKDA